ncbi:hypothetical protein ACP4OV_031557 [Aristida adscensionis]
MDWMRCSIPPPAAPRTRPLPPHAPQRRRVRRAPPPPRAPTPSRWPPRAVPGAAQRGHRRAAMPLRPQLPRANAAAALEAAAATASRSRRRQRARRRLPDPSATFGLPAPPTPSARPLRALRPPGVGPFAPPLRAARRSAYTIATDGDTSLHKSKLLQLKGCQQ